MQPGGLQTAIRSGIPYNEMWVIEKRYHEPRRAFYRLNNLNNGLSGRRLHLLSRCLKLRRLGILRARVLRNHQDIAA